MTDPSDCYRALAGEVYHTHLRCPTGRLIPAEWRRDGSGGLPLCPACRARTASMPLRSPAETDPAAAAVPDEGRSSLREDGSH
jgi:hypothetical protein